jgi:hypothetical protein
MILARLRRARRISALVALLCASVAAVGRSAASAVGERQIHEQVAAQADMMSVARSAVVEVSRPLGSHDRSVTGFVLVPHDALAVVGYDARSRRITPASLETLAAHRPRRLTFKYEATAPPSAL